MKKKNLLKITGNLKSFSQTKNATNYIFIKKALIKIRNKFKKNRKKIIESIHADINKPLKLCEVEFDSSINIWNYVIKSFNSINKKKKYLFSNNNSGRIIYMPIGLVGFITPWNYPLLTLSERLPFCIGSGCSAILKPSELTPKFAKILKKIINSENILKNRLSVLSDISPNTGKFLCRDPNIEMISFVGSTKTGIKISKQCSSSLKKTNLELGGKNAAIVCKSANIDYAVNKIIDAIFENGGQACVAISRVLIDKNIYDKFINKINQKTENLINSNILKIQPPANYHQKQKVISLINHIKNLYTKKSMKIFKTNANMKYYPIFVFSKKKVNSFLNREFFFPIVFFDKFKNINECIKLNNSTSYGLASYIFSSKTKEKEDLIKQIECGRIWVNSTLKWSPKLPVGGFNMSGKGRDMGLDGFLLYLTTKSVYIESNI